MEGCPLDLKVCVGEGTVCSFREVLLLIGYLGLEMWSWLLNSSLSVHRRRESRGKEFHMRERKMKMKRMLVPREPSVDAGCWQTGLFSIHPYSLCLALVA